MSFLLQWNCRGLISRWPEMGAFFRILAPIIIALQETWFRPPDRYNLNLPDYSFYRRDELSGERRHGGAALYISNNFTNGAFPLNTPLQAVAGSVRLHNRTIVVCSIYLPPDYDNAVLSHDLDDLISQFRHPFLLLGDFNCHSPIWSNDAQAVDHRGRIIENFLNKHNLVLLNKGDSTYHHISNGTETAIDLSICSPSLAPSFDWSIDGDVHGSDHFPIKIYTTFSPADDSVPRFLPRWNLRKADWTEFEKQCSFFRR